MFDLVYDALFFASYGNIQGLENIAVGSFDVLLAYIVAVVVSVIAALILKVPLLPGKPYRYSFDISALYPTPIIAGGLLSIFLVLNYTFLYKGLLLAVVIGIVSALFVKYLFYYIFPMPLNDDSGEDI